MSAERLGVSPVLAIAANSSGGVTGKMISPQSIAVACAATGLVGREADLFRFTIRHSLALVAILGGMTMLQANWLAWMIPTGRQGAGLAAAGPERLVTQGWAILGVTGLLLFLLSRATRRVPAADTSGGTRTRA